MRSREIIQDMIEGILSGEIERDSKLPSEAKLSEQYECNRHTLRKAIDYLIERGYVRKTHSGHAYVNHDPSKYSLKLGSLYDLFSARDIKTEVLQFEKQTPTAEIAAKMRIKPDEKVWSIVRVRWAMGKPHHIEFTSMPVNLFPNLTAKDCEASLLAYIEYEMDMEISHGIKTMRAATVSQFAAEALHLNVGDLVLQVENVGYLTNGRIYEVSTNLHCNDEGIIYYARR